MIFSKLPQLVDMRGELKSKGMYSKRTKTITHRVSPFTYKKNLQRKKGYDCICE